MRVVVTLAYLDGKHPEIRKDENDRPVFINKVIQFDYMWVDATLPITFYTDNISEVETTVEQFNSHFRDMYIKSVELLRPKGLQKWLIKKFRGPVVYELNDMIPVDLQAYFSWRNSRTRKGVPEYIGFD